MVSKIMPLSTGNPGGGGIGGGGSGVAKQIEPTNNKVKVNNNFIGTIFIRRKSKKKFFLSKFFKLLIAISSN